MGSRRIGNWFQTPNAPKSMTGEYDALLEISSLLFSFFFSWGSMAWSRPLGPKIGGGRTQCQIGVNTPCNIGQHPELPGAGHHSSTAFVLTSISGFPLAEGSTYTVQYNTFWELHMKPLTLHNFKIPPNLQKQNWSPVLLARPFLLFFLPNSKIWIRHETDRQKCYGRKNSGKFGVSAIRVQWTTSRTKIRPKSMKNVKTLFYLPEQSRGSVLELIFLAGEISVSLQRPFCGC